MPNVECVHDAKAIVGESAIWDADTARLYWADIDAGKIHVFDPAKGPERVLEVGERVGCLAIRESGGAIIGTESGVYALALTDGAVERLVDPEADRPQNRFNDSCTDRQGRWWFGSVGMTKPQAPTAAFYRMDHHGTVTRWLDGIYTTNGLAFSPDGRTMYFSDSHPDVRTIWAADYDVDDGEPGERRVFFDTRAVAGRPDGGTVDADGCYWMAGVSGWQLVRITPAGEVDMTIDLPVERPSKPAFGGGGLDTLYVTSISAGTTPGTTQDKAGGLFAVTGLPAKGLPSVRFRG
ncbi:MAG: SMP-30/gluconolactonase/LRE family protein [Pseudomonadota bacterium]